MKCIPETSKTINISLLLVILTGLVLIAAKLYFYTIHGDDPWFAEEAFWLVKSGRVRSEFFSTMLDYGVQQFAYHKLHIWLAALAIKLFGLSYLILKSITLGFFCIFLLVVRRYYLRFYQEDAVRGLFIFLAFILINSLVLELVFVYRPEIAIMCFGFIAYYFLQKSEVTESIWDIVLAGIFAGLCALMHLNGIIFIAAGFILLLVNQQYKKAIIFGIIATAVASVYFIDILPNHLTEFWMQFRHDPAIPKGQFSIATLLGRLLGEYQRFFGHGYESGYSLLLLTVLLVDIRYIWAQRELRNCLIYFATLSITLAAISPGKNHYYLLFGMPYAGLLASAVILRMLRSRKVHGIRRKVLFTVGVLYVAANIPHAVAIINDGRGGHHLVQSNASVMAHFNIQPGDKVLAPLNFIFNSIEKVDIQGVDAFLSRAQRGYVPMTAKAFFSEAVRNDRKFILMNSGQLAMLKITPDKTQEIDNYKYLGAMGGYSVFKYAEQ